MSQLFHNEDCDAHFNTTLAAVAAADAPLRVVWADIRLFQGAKS